MPWKIWIAPSATVEARSTQSPSATEKLIWFRLSTSRAPIGPGIQRPGQPGQDHQDEENSDQITLVLL